MLIRCFDAGLGFCVFDDSGMVGYPYQDSELFWHTCIFEME